MNKTVGTPESQYSPLPLQVKGVRMGIDQINERHFISIFLQEEPEGKTITEIADRLRHYHVVSDEPFMQREFLGTEIHIYPSPRSEIYFNKAELAIKEYQRILKVVFRLEKSLYHAIPLDRDLLPFDQRPNKQKEAKKIASCCKHF